MVSILMMAIAVMPVLTVPVPAAPIAMMPIALVPILPPAVAVPGIREMALHESTILRSTLAIEPAALELCDLADQCLKPILLPVGAHGAQPLGDLRHQPLHADADFSSPSARVSRWRLRGVVGVARSYGIVHGTCLPYESRAAGDTTCAGANAIASYFQLTI